MDREQAYRYMFRERTYRAVRKWVRRLGVPARDRADVAQDVLLAGLKSFPTYDPERSRPERWLNRIAVHVVAHYRELARHRWEELGAPLDREDERPRADEELAAVEGAAELQQMVDALPAPEREVIIAQFFREDALIGLAAESGISYSTLYKRGLRGMRALRLDAEQRDGARRGTLARRRGATACAASR